MSSMAPVKKSETLNAFKVAYKVVRDNSKEIYKAFGFMHLSDATQYYVHPDNSFLQNGQISKVEICAGT